MTLEATADRDTSVRERLRGCLRFAHRTLTTADRGHPLWSVHLGDVTGYDKLLLEAALFAVIADRGGRCPGEVQQLVAAVREGVDSPRVLAGLRRQPAQAATLATALVVLDHFDRTTDDEHAVLAAALATPYVESGERVPFRLLDRRWVLHLAGRGPLVDHAALATSAACRPMHPIYMSREDAYAITHTVMYVTDFGTSAPPAELRTEDLADTVDACLAFWCDQRDYDLVAELLLAQVLLAGRMSDYGRIAWRDCLRTWDEFGFLPSPSLSAAQFAEQEGDDERAQYALHHMYHTILVAGLLCHALDTRGAGVDGGPAGTGDAADAGDAAPAGDAEPADPPAPRHHPDRQAVRAAATAARSLVARYFELTDEQARDVVGQLAGSTDAPRVDELRTRWAGPSGAEATVSLVRMARDAVAIEAARDYDLAGLITAVRQAVDAGDVTPSVLAAAGFLARQVRPDGALGERVDGAGATSAAVSAAAAGCLTLVDAAWPGGSDD